MKIAISAESTIDLSKEQLTQWEIKTLPFTLILGDRSVLDGEITPEEMFDYTDKTGTLPKTSAVNEFQYEEHFQSLFDQGYEAIIHFALSSAISSACQNAQNVASRMKNVYVIDTHSLSTGIALQAIYARKLANAGKLPEEIVPLCLKRLPFDQTSFSLESVNYLYKGGRCSMLSMLGANLLHLKPEILVKPETGKMVAGQKFRGKMMQAVMGYVESVLSEFNNPDKELVFLTYSTAPEEVLEAVKARLQQAGFRNIVLTRAGGTISSHCGPHCLGILYMNDGEHTIE